MSEINVGEVSKSKDLEVRYRSIYVEWDVKYTCDKCESSAYADRLSLSLDFEPTLHEIDRRVAYATNRSRNSQTPKGWLITPDTILCNRCIATSDLLLSMHTMLTNVSTAIKNWRIK